MKRKATRCSNRLRFDLQQVLGFTAELLTAHPFQPVSDDLSDSNGPPPSRDSGASSTGYSKLAFASASLPSRCRAIDSIKWFIGTRQGCSTSCGFTTFGTPFQGAVPITGPEGD
jgi:hypothetical protein